MKILCTLFPRQVLCRSLTYRCLPPKRDPPKKIASAKVLTNAENLKTLEEKEEMKQEKAKAKEPRKQEREKKAREKEKWRLELEVEKEEHKQERAS